MRRVAGLGLVVVALALACPPRPARAMLPEGAVAELARRSWAPALMDKDPATWLDALRQMRRFPEAARQGLLLALGEAPPSPLRWRLVRSLAEFGQTADLPVVLKLLESPASDFERQVTLGTARALYPPSVAGREPLADLAQAVAEFLFIQTQPPQPYDAKRESTASLDDEVFRQYQGAGLPQEIVTALQPLRGRAFPDLAALTQAMQERLKARDWRRYQPALLKPVESVPPRALVEGLLRVQVRNPLPRSLLVWIGFDAWRGRFEPRPEESLLYVPAGESARLDQPVRLIAPMQGPPARIDLALREVHQPPVPLFRKLYIPLQP